MKNVTKWLLTGLALAPLTMRMASAAMPDLALQTADGHAFNLRAERGHWVILNYWATWCEACREEMPMLSAFAASHPSVKLIGVTYEKINVQTLRQFVARHPPGFPVAHVDERNLPRALKPTYFGIHALPMTFVMAPDGSVAKRWVGEIDKAKLDAMFDNVGQH